jgi:hypothetical protein
LDDVLGLIALAGYIAAIVGLAGGVTYVVIKIFPTERSPKKAESEEAKPAKEEKPSNSASGEQAAGSLFRRSKRGSG